MTMKIFVRSSGLGESRPQVVAYYDDDTDVPADAHGPGMMVINVPPNALVQETLPSGILDAPRLVPNWRELASTQIVAGEAKRRIEEVLPPAEQLATLRELIDFIIQHGIDVSQWPAEAKTRKAKIDDAWNYVRSVKEHASSMKPAPANFASDKVWPTRIKKIV
jgi:hypothetical protein